MGTRCLTVFHEEDETEIVVMYRQFDGYPDGHGKELADFLKNKKIVNGIGCDMDESKIFNGMGCLTAMTIAHFKQDRVGGFYLHPAGTRNCGEDYIYHVRGNVDSEPIIEIEGENFKGYASTFDDWLKSNQEDENE